MPHSGKHKRSPPRKEGSRKSPSKWHCRKPYDPSTATKTQRIASCIRSPKGRFPTRQNCVEKCYKKMTSRKRPTDGLVVERIGPSGKKEHLDTSKYSVEFVLAWVTAVFGVPEM